MAGRAFKYKIDERVIFVDGAIVKVIGRRYDISGRAYLIKYKSGRLGGYVSEQHLRPLEEGDE